MLGDPYTKVLVGRNDTKTELHLWAWVDDRD